MDVEQPIIVFGSPNFNNVVPTLAPVVADVIAEREEIEQIEQLLLLGNQSFQENDFHSAIKLYSEALEIENTNANLLIARCNAYIQDNQIEKALEDANSMLNSRFSNDKSVQSEARYLIVCVHRAANQFSLALETSLELYLQDNSFRNIESIVYEACDNVLKGPTLKDDMKKLDFSYGMVKYAELMLDKKLLSQAQRVIECLVFQESLVSPDILTKALLVGARILSAQNSTERAIATYQECVLRAWKLQLLGVETEARLELSQLFYNLKDYFQAAFSFEKCLTVIELIESEVSLLEPLGWTKDDLARHKVGILCCISESFLNLNEVSLALKHANQIRNSLSVVDGEAKSDQKEKQKSDWLKFIESRESEILAKIWDKKRNFVEAMECSEKFLWAERKLKEKLYEALLLCGRLNRKLKRPSDAQKIFSEILDKSLDDSNKEAVVRRKSSEVLCLALYNLGKLEMESCNFEKAVQHFEDCVKQSKKVGSDRNLECKSCVLLARCHSGLKKYAQAVYNLECGLALQKETSVDVSIACLAEMALVFQEVGTQSELERARASLEEMIPRFHESALKQFIRDGHFLGKKTKLLEDVSNAYVNILVRLGHPQAALIACETARRFKFVAMFAHRSELIGGKCEKFRNRLGAPIDIEKIMDTPEVRGIPTFYFHISENNLFVWLISVKKGMQYFHKHTMEKSEASVFSLLNSLRERFGSRNSGLYGFENRIILDSESKFRVFPHIKDAAKGDETEQELVKQLQHFIWAPLKSELKKMTKQKSFAFVISGIAGVVPFVDIFTEYWRRNISEVCPTVEVFESIEMMNWLQFLKYDHIFSHKQSLGTAAVHNPYGLSSALDNARPGVNDQKAITGTAEILGWSNFSGGGATQKNEPGMALKEVPSLQYQRQIRSAGGDTVDLGSLYKGVNANLDRISSEQGYAIIQGLENESLRTDGSFKKPQSTSSAKGYVAARKSVSRSYKKPDIKMNASESPDTQQSEQTSVSGLSTELGSAENHLKVRAKLEDSFSTLISKTWNDKQVRTSKIAVENYSPVRFNRIFRFIGAPILPSKVSFLDFLWKPLKCLSSAQEELKTCSGYFKSTALMGEQCTKNEALKFLEKCSCVHLATYINYETAHIAFTPNELHQKMNNVGSEMCCASMQDLLDIDLGGIDLLVLSAFPSQRHSDVTAFWNMPILLIALGVKCVVYSCQAVPCKAVSKFYHYFYRALRKIEPACKVSEALVYAKEHMKKDPNFSSAENWKSFQMLGLDVEIQGKEIVHEMLDEVINGAEKSLQVDPLNVKVNEGIVPTSHAILSELRKLFADLIIGNMNDLSILDPLFNLTLLAVEQRFGANHKRELLVHRVKDPRLIQTQSVLVLLQFLRFDFQPYGCTDEREDLNHPVVIWPYWDKNGLLKPASDVFRNLILLKDNTIALEEIVAVLRLTLKTQQVSVIEGKVSSDGNSGLSASLDGEVADNVDMISLLIDVLSLSEHAPQVQLMITDSGVRKVWNCSPCRRLLTAIGFHQVDLALMSYRNLANARYQQSVLRILCALSGKDTKFF